MNLNDFLDTILGVLTYLAGLGIFSLFVKFIIEKTGQKHAKYMHIMKNRQTSQEDTLVLLQQYIKNVKKLISIYKESSRCSILIFLHIPQYLAITRKMKQQENDINEKILKVRIHGNHKTSEVIERLGKEIINHAQGISEIIKTNRKSYPAEAEKFEQQINNSFSDLIKTVREDLKIDKIYK